MKMQAILKEEYLYRSVVCHLKKGCIFEHITSYKYISSCAYTHAEARAVCIFVNLGDLFLMKESSTLILGSCRCKISKKYFFSF